MPRPTTAACLTLGAALGLLFSALPDAVLLPAVDRWPPRAVGLALTGLLASAGWQAAAPGGRARTLGLRALVLLGLAALAGGMLSSWLVPVWRDELAAALREPGSPYYLLVTLACLTAAAPAALSLGALAGAAVQAGSPRARAGLALGVALGLLLGAPLIAMLLAGVRALQVAGLLGGCAAVFLIEQQPLTLEPRRLSAAAAFALAAAGGAVAIACRELELTLDRGALVGPLFTALLGAGAAVVLLARRPPRWSAWIPAALVALALCAPAAPFVLPADGGVTAPFLARIALVALALGALLGTALAAEEGRHSAPLAFVPAVLVALVPVVALIGLPALGPRPALMALGAAAALPLLPQARRHGVALIALVTLGALAALGIGPRPPQGALPVIESRRLDDGLLARVFDPATGRALVALDGHAALGTSAGQSRRLAHLPLLLHPAPRSVLVVGADGGETARAAWWHRPFNLHWLQPLPVPPAWLEAPWPGDQPPTSGSERQFLAIERPPYDVIVMAPDARAARRADLVGTVEFYTLAQRRLTPGGLLCQWWDLAASDLTDLKAVLASGQEVFPHCYLALDQPRTRRAALAMLFTDRPLWVSPAIIDMRLASRRDLALDFEEIGLDGLGITCLVTADRGLVELLAPREEALHDDRPALGVRAALRPGGATERLRLGLRTFAQWRRDPMEWIDVPAAAVPPIAAIVRDRYRSWQHLFGGALGVVAARGAAGVPFDLEPPVETPLEEADALLEALVGLPDWDYLRDRVLGVAQRLEAAGSLAAAEEYLRRAVSKDEGSAAIRFALASLVERKGDRDDALVLYRTVLAFEPGHPGALAKLEGLEQR